MDGFSLPADESSQLSPAKAPARRPKIGATELVTGLPAIWQRLSGSRNFVPDFATDRRSIVTNGKFNLLPPGVVPWLTKVKN